MLLAVPGFSAHFRALADCHFSFAAVVVFLWVRSLLSPGFDPGGAACESATFLEVGEKYDLHSPRLDRSLLAPIVETHQGFLGIILGTRHRSTRICILGTIIPAVNRGWMSDQTPVVIKRIL